MEEDLAREDDHNPSSPNLELIKNLSPRDVRYLVHAEEELSQTKVSKLVPWEKWIWKLWLCVVIQAVVLFQVFKRIWPTKMSRQYFDLFDSIPYSEKLMGGPTTTILLCLLAETFELFYGENRQAGQAMVNSYCKARHHLQVQKPEQFLLPKPDLGLNLPPLKELPQQNLSVPVSRQNIF